MNDNQWQLVTEVTDPIIAEILRGLLESHGIQVHLSQDGLGHTIGFTVGPMGVVQILVPSGDHEKASKLISDYYEDEEQ